MTPVTFPKMAEVGKVRCRYQRAAISTELREIPRISHRWRLKTASPVLGHIGIARPDGRRCGRGFSAPAAAPNIGDKRSGYELTIMHVSVSLGLT
jgi:hypothetical protein